MPLTLAFALPAAAAFDLPAVLGSAGKAYVDCSTARPHVVAAATAGSIILAADVTCQAALERKEGGIDVRRTAALAIFGAWHYGIP